VTHTPVNTKQTNRVASKNHTSGIDKKIFSFGSHIQVSKGKITEKTDQNSKNNFSVLAGLMTDCYNPERKMFPHLSSLCI
jgi:hypothetical protein